MSMCPNLVIPQTRNFCLHDIDRRLFRYNVFHTVSYERLCTTVAPNVTVMFRNKKALAPEWRRAAESYWSLYFLTNEVERQKERRETRWRSISLF